MRGIERKNEVTLCFKEKKISNHVDICYFFNIDFDIWKN